MEPTEAETAARGVCVARCQTASGKAEVWDAAGQRSLWFDSGILQTTIFPDRPDQLAHAANRAMLAHLMFGPAPRRVLLAGAGGGAVGRWFDARSPGTQGCAVEIDPAVARLAREHFGFPPPSGRWQIEVADVRDTLRRPGPGGARWDFILVDLECGGRTPDWVVSDPFLRDCREALASDGVLTINLLLADGPALLATLQAIRASFLRRTICLPIPGHANLVVMAFRKPPRRPTPARLAEAASRWGLAFEQFLERIEAANPPGSGALR